MKIKFHYRKHKMRFDRGRMWYSNLNSIFIAFLVVIFGSDNDFFMKVIAAFSVFVFIYVIGYIDDKLRLLDKEQKQVGDRNPKFDEIIKLLNDIKQKQNENISDNTNV